jgi:hypothetical protein
MLRAISIGTQERSSRRTGPEEFSCPEGIELRKRSADFLDEVILLSLFFEAVEFGVDEAKFGDKRIDAFADRLQVLL